MAASPGPIPASVSYSFLTVTDLLYSFDKKIQTDVAILDISRAVDTIPYERLLRKLHYYGIVW